jgi:hypothetical protein
MGDTVILFNRRDNLGGSTLSIEAPTIQPRRKTTCGTVGMCSNPKTNAQIHHNTPLR